MTIEVAVELVIPDNAAYTVTVALRRLGYAELARVERADVYRLDLSPGADPAGFVERLARAEVIFNPNKHRLSYSVPDRGTASGGGAAAQFEAVISERDDDQRALAGLLRGPFGLRELAGLERAVAWRLFEEGGSASRERLEWACAALLCNRISQTSAVRLLPLRQPVRLVAPEGAAQ